MIDAPGLYSMLDAEYHRDPCVTPSLSRSVAHILLDQSPWHAMIAHPRLNPHFELEDDSKFDFGSAAHDMLLRGGEVCVTVDADDYKTKAARTARAEALADGFIPVLAKHAPQLQAMVTACHEQLRLFPEAENFFDVSGTFEGAIFWQERDVWCRVKFDWMSASHAWLVDYKSTKASANPAIWGSSVFREGYDIQHALYRRAVHSLTGKTPEFRFVVQESEPPFAVSVVGLSPDAAEHADHKLDLALDAWAVCMKTGVWPGYPTHTCFVDVPPWVDKRWIERSSRMSAMKEDGEEDFLETFIKAGYFGG